MHFDNGLSALRRLLVDRILHAITASLAHNSSCWKEEKTKAQGWGTLAHNYPCVCTRHMKAAHLYFFTWTYEGRKGGKDEVFVRVFCGPTQQGIRERWWRRHTDRPPPLLRFWRLPPPFLNHSFQCSACSTESFIHEWLEASEPEDILISSKWAFIFCHFCVEV